MRVSEQVVSSIMIDAVRKKELDLLYSMSLFGLTLYRAEYLHAQNKRGKRMYSNVRLGLQSMK